MTGIAAAIANAVEDAIGARIRDLPITPEKVFARWKNSGSFGGNNLMPHVFSSTSNGEDLRCQACELKKTSAPLS